MSSDEYQNQIDAIEKELAVMGESDTIAAPEPRKPDTFFTFARDCINAKDSTKIANFNKEELGKTRLSVRGCQTIALVAKTYELNNVYAYFTDYAEVIAKTSMGRDATFLKLMVTTITKKINRNAGGSDKNKSWFSTWGKKKDEQTGGIDEE